MASEMSLALSSLHVLLRQLAEAEAALAEGPRAVTIAEKQVAQAEQAIEQQKQTIKASRKTADELNLKLKTKETELTKFEGQLNTASSNKEYEITRGQITAAKTSRVQMEETAFAAMEEIDTAQSRLKELEAELVIRKKAVADAKASFDARKPELESRTSTLLDQIKDAEKVIPGDGKAMYVRLRKAHGSDALSVMEDGFCSVCSTKVTNQDMVRIRMSDFMFCRDCGRILYFAE
jgi:predicted  nucleic acid-binding Zn-ribbon protein